MRRLLTVLGLVSLAAALPAPLSAAAAATAESTAAELVAEINRARATRGLGALTPHPTLDEVAAWRADQIRRAGDLPDSAQDISRLSRKLFATGYAAHRWTESAAVGRGDLLAGWRQQRPGAYREAVFGDYTEVGVGFSLFGEEPLVVLLFALPKITQDLRRVAPLADLSEVRRQVLARVNEIRSERDLAPLKRVERLDEAAQEHATDMFDRSFYDHVNPDGEGPGDRVRHYTHRFRRVAENIARGIFDPAEVVDRWMGSRGHRRNILSPALREMGVGVAYGQRDDEMTVYWVQLFGG